MLIKVSSVLHIFEQLCCRFEKMGIYSDLKISRSIGIPKFVRKLRSSVIGGKWLYFYITSKYYDDGLFVLPNGNRLSVSAFVFSHYQFMANRKWWKFSGESSKSRSNCPSIACAFALFIKWKEILVVLIEFLYFTISELQQSLPVPVIWNLSWSVTNSNLETRTI